MPFTNASDPQRLLTLLYLNQFATNYPDYPPGGFLSPELLSPDYVFPSKHTALLGAIVSLALLALLVTSARLYLIRFWPGTRLGIEDVFISLATIFMVAFSIVAIVSVQKGGLGYHAYDCHLGEIAIAWKLSQPLIQLYIYGTMSAKLSNLFFLLRIAPTKLTWTRQLLKGVIYFGIAEALVTSLLLLLLCKPVSAAWDLNQWLHKTKCLDLRAVALSTNILFVVVDTVMLFTPISIIRSLNLARHTTIAVSLLWLCGLLSCIACGVKAYQFARLYTSFDLTWVGASAVLWAEVEACLTLITVTLPTVDILLVKFIPRRLRDWLAVLDEQWDSKAKDSTLDSSNPDPKGLDWEKIEFAKQLDPRFAHESKLPKLSPAVAEVKDDGSGALSDEAYIESKNGYTARSLGSVDSQERIHSAASWHRAAPAESEQSCDWLSTLDLKHESFLNI